MTDIMKIAHAKRDRLVAELDKLNDFIRMADLLVREDGAVQARAAAAAASPPKPPMRTPPKSSSEMSAADGKTTADDVHRTLSSVLRAADEKAEEAGGDAGRRSGLWRTAPQVAARG